MVRDRFLIGILGVIGVLIVAALILFFTRQSQVDYVDDISPAGALQNYILALQRRDYERAYSYLADSSGKPDFNRFRQPFLTYQGEEISNIAVEIGETVPDETDDTALVQLILVRGGRNIFSEIYRETNSASLVRQADGWKITYAPYPYWSYDWPLLVTPESQTTPTPP